MKSKNHLNKNKFTAMNKTITFFTVLAFSLIITSCNAQDKNQATSLDQSVSKIEVLDFHTTNRCITCKAIEANTKYTLETYFANELKNGKITFQVVDISKEENYELAKKFKASGTSLFLNIIGNKKEKHIDLTAFAFTYGKKKDEFADRLKNKLEKQLEKL